MLQLTYLIKLLKTLQYITFNVKIKGKPLMEIIGAPKFGNIM